MRHEWLINQQKKQSGINKHAQKQPSKPLSVSHRTAVQWSGQVIKVPQARGEAFKTTNSQQINAFVSSEAVQTNKTEPKIHPIIHCSNRKSSFSKEMHFRPDPTLLIIIN